ncbi:MAG: hypothetical protein GY699_06560 [Desulfobacteraceae bacterium]|nr:hypothetical protein [Desulfobacteraceae bacterium]
MTDKQKAKLANPLEETVDKPVEAINKKKLFIITAILFLAFLVLHFGINIFNTEPTLRVTGRILSPLKNDVTGKEIKVVGETKNVTADQYIWLAFDNLEFAKSWPKAHIPGNIKFSTIVLAEELKGDQRLSLYLLNEKLHKQWKEWQSKEKPLGVRMLSGKRHLHFIRLFLEK